MSVPAVSVLCPTRLRPERLAASLKSLRDNATSRENYEVLVAADLDDPTDYTEFDYDTLTRSDRFGYGRLHEYFNRLANTARGDWLMLWNDDCMMCTAGWDHRIVEHPPRHVLAPHTHHDPLIVLPVIPRAWTVACGHYAGLLHVDSWWQDLGHALDVVEWVDVQIDHQRFDKPGRETPPDDVYRQREFRLGELYDDRSPVRAQWLADVETVRSLLAA